MPEGATRRDLLGTVARGVEALNRREFDAAFVMFAPDAVWDLSSAGFGSLEMSALVGREAIRSFWESELTSAFDDFETVNEVYDDLGNGVTFSVAVLRGRPEGTSRFVEHRVGVVWAWRDGLIVRATNYTDVDEARAAAERLAEERE
jgi:ketosteroid isomerase-like protein